VAVVILHSMIKDNWQLLNLSREGYMRSMLQMLLLLTCSCYYWHAPTTARCFNILKKPTDRSLNMSVMFSENYCL